MSAGSVPCAACRQLCAVHGLHAEPGKHGHGTAGFRSARAALTAAEAPLGLMPAAAASAGRSAQCGRAPSGSGAAPSGSPEISAPRPRPSIPRTDGTAGGSGPRSAQREPDGAAVAAGGEGTGRGGGSQNGARSGG